MRRAPWVAVRVGASLAGALLCFVGALTVVHATGVLAGHEAAAVRVLVLCIAIAGILSTISIIRSLHGASARSLGIALAWACAIALTAAVLWGLDALVVVPVRDSSGVAGSLVSIVGAALVLAGGASFRRGPREFHGST